MRGRPNTRSATDAFEPGCCAVGHFTAIAWKSTTKVGCAINLNCDNMWPPEYKNDAVVCRYSPSGNVIYDGGMSMYLSNVKAPESCGKEAPPVTKVDEDDTPPSGGGSGGGSIDFAVAETSDCNCKTGKCKTFFEESGARSNCCDSNALAARSLATRIPSMLFLCMRRLPC